MHARLLACLLLVVLIQEPLARAWGPAGHRITGRIASAFVKPQTAIAVAKMLGNHTWWDFTEQWPQGAISWADLYKLDPSGMWSYDVHFSQTNGFPDFILSRDCWNSCDPGLANISYCKLDQELANCCVEAGIEKYKDELWLQIVAKQTNNSAGANNTNDPLTKLLLLAHFIGDVHQPMHVNIRPNDMGGNDFEIQWYGNMTCDNAGFVRPCNLHAAWDFYMIDTRLDDYGPPPINYTVVDPREGLWTADIITEMEGMCCQGMEGHNDAVHWASESILFSSMAYEVPQYSNLGYEYYNATIPVVAERLYRAGRRLADVLDFIFDGTHKECKDCYWWDQLCKPTTTVRPEGRSRWWPID